MNILPPYGGNLYGGFSVCKRGVVKRDDLDSGTPKRGSPYRFDILKMDREYLQC